MINNFVKFEKEQNLNNISILLEFMNQEINRISSTINDYSKWDDSYDFILNQSQSYLFDNFREGTDTLSDLRIDFILYTNRQKDILFSKYDNDSLKDDKIVFEKYLIDTLYNENTADTIIKYKSTFIYLIKSEILKSDKTGVVSGWIYSGKIINIQDLKTNFKVFQDIQIEKETRSKNDESIILSHFKDIQINTITKNGKLKNIINLYDTSGNFVFAITTISSRDIVQNGQKTILILNLIVALFAFCIFFISYRNQNRLLQYSELLEFNVSKKTEALEKSLEKIKEQNKELYLLSCTDSLTRIHNRRSYFQESEIVRENAISQNKSFCILMIDIDYFKKINDIYGHAIGDKILIEFCNIVNSFITNEIFGRIGGEEFCITFFDKTKEEVHEIGENIRKKCEESSFQVENNHINFTVSLGLSCIAFTESLDKILEVSDLRLYKAKRSGRNMLVSI
ncbi:MAG: diguanylate cyclase [Arcobacteraceae bacterium]